jgi:hypothetical protein
MKKVSQDHIGLLIIIGIVTVLMFPLIKSFGPPSQNLSVSAERTPSSVSSDANHLNSMSAEKKLDPKNQPQDSHDSKSIALTLDCQKDFELVVDARFLRLKSSQVNCFKSPATHVSLENQANGFTGSVIFHQKGFTTDYIELSEGANTIVFHGNRGNGSSFERKVSIIRRSVASILGN